MRIYGNRQLKTLPGQQTRPTAARVREALFNIWRSRSLNCRWLDICTGIGTMGAEALCRGAASVVGIEKSSGACRVIRHNWQTVAQPQQEFEVMRGDARIVLKKLAGKAFDCIYFDPPYDSGLYAPILDAIATLNLLAPEGEIAVEHDPKVWEASAIAGLRIVRQKHYGSTTVSFYERADTES
jgi:16S rRNA (guanine966-N2)-methyltransferase